MEYRFALNNDIPSLVGLINRAYRNHQDRSWTNEVQFVQGTRITSEQLFDELNNPDFLLMIVENKLSNENQIIACIGLSFCSDQVEIGTFCIDPAFQQDGLGKKLLFTAEQFAQIYNSNIKKITMHVLNVRKELIAYYERRGYQKTGNTEMYPINANVGTPLVDLNLIEMQKSIS